MTGKEIAITNDYPTDKFNLLIPIKTLQELSPLHKVVINQVQINPDESKREVYKEKNGELALTKKGLAKLMTAANIQMVESKSVTPQKCQRCAEIAGKTKVAPKCYECPYVDDVAYQVTLAVPEPSGTWRKVVATKEIRMADEKAKMSEKQYNSFFPFRTEQCETKALNRALREALMINATYKANDLNKPFAVAYVVPNMSDPDIKKAVAAKYAESTTALFGLGNKADVKQIASNINENVTVIGPNEEDNEEAAPWDDTQVQEVEEVNPEHVCQECGCIIVGNDKSTVDEIIAFTKKNFKKNLCTDCGQQALEEHNKKAKGGK